MVFLVNERKGQIGKGVVALLYIPYHRDSRFLSFVYMLIVSQKYSLSFLSMFSLCLDIYFTLIIPDRMQLATDILFKRLSANLRSSFMASLVFRYPSLVISSPNAHLHHQLSCVFPLLLLPLPSEAREYLRIPKHKTPGGKRKTQTE